MSELWWPEQKALVMSIVEGKVREDEEPSSICSHLDPSLQGPGVTAPRGLSNARTFMQRELLITAPGKVTGLLSWSEFHCSGSCQAQEENGEENNFYGIISSQTHKTCQHTWLCIPPSVCHPLAVKLIRFVGGKVMSSVLSSL